MDSAAREPIHPKELLHTVTLVYIDDMGLYVDDAGVQSAAACRLIYRPLLTLPLQHNTYSIHHRCCHMHAAGPTLLPYACSRTHMQHSPQMLPYACSRTHMQHSPQMLLYACSRTHMQHSPQMLPYACNRTQIQHSPQMLPYACSRTLMQHSPQMLLYACSRTHMQHSPQMLPYACSRTHMQQSPQMLPYACSRTHMHAAYTTDAATCMQLDPHTWVVFPGGCCCCCCCCCCSLIHTANWAKLSQEVVTIVQPSNTRLALLLLRLNARGAGAAWPESTRCPSGNKALRSSSPRISRCEPAGQ